MQLVDEKDFVVFRWSDLRDLDWWLLIPVFILLSFSFLLLTSANNSEYLVGQFTHLLFAFFITSMIPLLRIKFWQENAIWFYIVNVLLLFIVLVAGISSMGAQRWIGIGLIKFQPSEVAKIAIIISLASWFTKFPIKGYKDIFISLAIVTLPFCLIFKQPDLGTSLTCLAIFFGMAFWAGASITQLLVVTSPILSLIFSVTGTVIISIGTIQVRDKIIELGVTNSFALFLFFFLIWIVINYKPWRSPWIVLWLSTIFLFNFIAGIIRPVLWSFLRPYQQQRLTIFLNPESDPQGAGYHIIQSLLAIGNGGLFGYGWQHGRLTKGSYVPAQHTDFIFSIAGEEFGFIGAAFLICVFSILLWRILYIANNSNNQFASLASVGIFSFFAFHMVINIGMTLGLMPITGVPLPLLSYGGTALFAELFSVFFLLSVSWRTLPRKIF